MIIDSHVWLSKREHWGGKGVMDDAMYAAGWAARGLGAKTGLVKGMSAEQMIERMDEAGVDMAVLSRQQGAPPELGGAPLVRGGGG